MTTFRALTHGLRQAASPKLLLTLWLVNVVAALPATAVLTQTLDRSFGHSLAARNLVEGFDTAWYGEFSAEAEGIGRTFSPSLLGVGAVFDNLESWWSGRLFTENGGVLVGLGAIYALLWALLLGGILERLVRPDGGTGLDRLFWAGGRYFLRFLGLAALSGVLYYGVYRLSRWYFKTVQNATRDVTRETTVFHWVLLGAALTVILLALVRMVFDYAKIATVRDERRNFLAAAWEGLRFVVSRPLRTAGVVLGYAVLGVVLVALYALVAPGAGQSTWLTVILALLVGQVYLVGRLFLRVGLLGAEVGVFGG